MPRGKRIELDRWLKEHQVSRIGEAEFGRIMQALAPVSENYLRKLVRESGLPLDPMVEGVRQATLDELERSLVAFARLYEQADVFHKAAIRKVVITAKDHARFVAASTDSPRKREEKKEASLWLTTWLENPPLFPDWVRLRRQASARP